MLRSASQSPQTLVLLPLANYYYLRNEKNRPCRRSAVCRAHLASLCCLDDLEISSEIVYSDSQVIEIVYADCDQSPKIQVKSNEE